MPAVYQLSIGTKSLPLADCLLRGGDDTAVEFGYGFWLLDLGAETWLVDCGFRAPAAARKTITYERTPRDALRAVGVDAAEISAVVLTHLHFDHAGTLPDFTNATVYLQRSELEYFSGPLMRFPLCASGLDPEDLAATRALEADGRLALLHGDGDVAPGVHVHHVGGHTPGTQLVSVTEGTRRVVLAADAAHTYANLAARVPFPVLHDVPASCIAFEVMDGLAAEGAEVVPGHDAEVLRRFPTVNQAASSTGSAVRLL